MNNLKRFGSNRASIEIYKQSEDCFFVDFFSATLDKEPQRINVPTIVLIGKEAQELKDFLNSTMIKEENE